MLFDVGDDVKNGRFDPRGLKYLGWKKIVYPETTIKSPRAKEVVEGEELSLNVEESVKAERKQHALGTRLRSHFAFAPITRSSTSDELFSPSRSSSRLGPLTVFAGHSNSCGLRCLTAFGHKRPSWTSSPTFHSATSTPPSLHRPAPSRPHSLRLRTLPAQF